MRLDIEVEPRDFREFTKKKVKKIKKIIVQLDAETKNAFVLIYIITKKQNKLIEEKNSQDFEEILSKLVNLGYFDSFNPVSSILSDKQFLCYYLNSFFSLKSEEIARITHNSSSTIRDHLAKVKRKIEAYQTKLNKMNLELTILNNLSSLPLTLLEKITNSKLLTYYELTLIIQCFPSIKIMIQEEKENEFKLFTAENFSNLATDYSVYAILPRTNLFAHIIYLKKKKQKQKSVEIVK